MAISALRIGIEIEVLLCAKRMQDQYKSFEEFAQGLVQYYNSEAEGRPGQPEIGRALDPNFRYWFITEDGSICLSEDYYEDVRPCEISGSFAISC